MSNHGTIALIAWGVAELRNGHMVGISDVDWRNLRRKINDELRPYKMILKSAGRPQCVLTKRREARGTPRNKLRHRQLIIGSLQDCCRRALSEIDPTNYPLPDTRPWMRAIK